MKKASVTIFILTTAVIITFLIPVYEEDSISIAAPVISVSQQLNNAVNWKKWNADLKVAFKNDSANYMVNNDYQQHRFTIQTANQSILVKSHSSSNFEVTIGKRGNSGLYNISLTAGRDVNSATVFMEKKTSLFSKIFLSAHSKFVKENFIHSLKAFMETDSLYYGFSINIEPVIDTNVVIIKKQASNAVKFSVLPQLYKSLQNYIAVNNLKILQPPMMLFTYLPNDSVSVVAMLAVNKPAAAKNDSIRCLQMPVKGRMLVGKFKGKYKDRIQLQTAMQQYCLDKNIISIVSSYDKFIDNRVPKNEETIVEMEIHFPIM
jgi:hypothetical protein